MMMSYYSNPDVYDETYKTDLTSYQDIRFD